jgi:hypothetical protein
VSINKENIVFHEDLSYMSPENNDELDLNYNTTTLEDDNEDGDNEYAFIIVPVKVPNTKEGIKTAKKTVEVVQSSAENFDDQNLKSFQNMFQYKKVCYGKF